MLNQEEDFSIIGKRYQHVLEQIANAGHRSGNLKTRLVVVSKSQPLEIVQAAFAAGIRSFGENYAEEAVKKITKMQQNTIEWHMIGHVQSRKAALVAAHFTMLHSLDSLKLATRLDRLCEGLGRTLPVLLEVNVSGEESKFGFPAWMEKRWSEQLPVFEGIVGLPNLQVRGLMTMPPFFDEPDKTRPFFQRMRRLQEFLKMQIKQADWSELSMGTSADFLTAVEEGATIVRVGQAIFGPRPSHAGAV